MKVDFERLHWENYPSTDTPINADNLNRLEEGVAGLYSDVSEIQEELGGGVGEYVTEWLTEHGEQLNLRSPNGEKFGLMITPSNTLGTFKYTPDNMLIMGNSLVFGFSHGGESFGMAATSGENDFSYHLIESIKEYNPNVNVIKLYSSPFEHADTLESAQTFLTDNTAYWNDSLDLVVIEMGDNVDTEAKRTVFAQSFPMLLTKIRTQCSKARIICTGIWFNNSTVHNIMVTNANKYGCEFVDITPIRNSETEGELGATVYFKDGTTTTVTEGRVTHPGNLGMERIAEAIFNKLDIQ